MDTLRGSLGVTSRLFSALTPSKDVVEVLQSLFLGRTRIELDFPCASAFYLHISRSPAYTGTVSSFEPSASAPRGNISDTDRLTPARDLVAGEFVHACLLIRSPRGVPPHIYVSSARFVPPTPRMPSCRFALPGPPRLARAFDAPRPASTMPAHPRRLHQHHPLVSAG